MKIEYFGPNSDFFQTALIGSADLTISAVGNEFKSIVIMTLPGSEQVVTATVDALGYDGDGNIDMGTLTNLSFIGLGGQDAILSDLEWDFVAFLAALDKAGNGTTFDLEHLFNTTPIQIDASGASAGFVSDEFAVGFISPLEFTGSAFDDAVIGSYSDDTLYGGDGNDELTGRLGNDSIYGGGGDDVIYGQFGPIIVVNTTHRSEPLYDNDYLVGGLGKDLIFGDFGNDTIYGDNDVSDGLITTRLYFPDPGDDDIVYAGRGDDEVYGGAGDDYIYGGQGDDILYGGAGYDKIFGDDGDDLIFGGGYGGFIALNAAPDAAFVPVDTVGNKIKGGVGNDEIYGGGGNDKIRGNAGDDLIYGGQGRDLLFGGSGNDELVGGGSEDVIYGGRGNDVIFGGFDAIIYYIQAAGTQGTEKVAPDIYPITGPGNIMFGGAGHDEITGGFLDDEIYGGSGRDVLTAGVGDDLLSGGRGADVFVFDTKSDEGRNVITDFTNGRDLIRMDGTIFNSIESVETSGRGGFNTLITLSGGTEIILRGVDADSIGAEDFDFI